MNCKFKKSVLFYALFLVTLIACNSSEFEDSTSNDGGRNYIHLVEGQYQIFKYDTIFYKSAKRDTFSGYIKKEIGEEFVDNAGNKTNKLFVYWKRKIQDPFKLHRVETIKIEGDRLIESDDGLNFIKLAFPLSKNRKWFGNSLFDNSDDIIELVYGESIETITKNSNWQYLVEDIDIPIEINSLSFEKVLVINQVNDTTSISTRYVNEYYAENIGLIRKRMIILNKNNNTESTLLMDAEKGYVMNLEIIEFN